MLADDLPEVLDDELPRAEGLLGADAPALALGAEALQALDPLVPLDVLVVALLPARADAGRALGEAHPGETGENGNDLSGGGGGGGHWCGRAVLALFRGH